MASRKDKLVYDRNKFITDMSKEICRVMDRVGKQFIGMMRANLGWLRSFPEDWRDEVSAALDKRFEEITEQAITMVVGLIDADEDSFFTIRARVLEHGAGDKGDVGSPPIWHRRGIAGLNDALDGYNENPDTLARASYKMPDGFNHGPGRWFRDASALIDEIFNDEMETLFANFNPLKYIHS